MLAISCCDDTGILSHQVIIVINIVNIALLTILCRHRVNIGKLSFLDFIDKIVLNRYNIQDSK